MEMRDIPVYLFTGFLEAGKTRFIQETLEDERFNTGERTLLLLCEEGEEEYDPSRFSGKNVFVERLPAEDSIQPAPLAEMLERHNAERVVVEYNGMWMLDSLFSGMPENWVVYQEFLFFDSRSFLQYNANMRQLVYDKLQSADMVVFNRFTPDMDQMQFHKIVRGASRRADIAYESPAGEVSYDDIADPPPYDLNAPIVEIKDEDYAFWYRDMGEELDKYDGKTVRFKGIAVVSKELKPHSFIIGRQVMTCCDQDTKFMGLAAEWKKSGVASRDWLIVTAELRVEKHPSYGDEIGPVLYVKSLERSQPPQQEVATFY